MEKDEVTSKERVLAAMRHEQPNRTPLWHGVPKPEIMEGLLWHYGARDEEELLRAIGDDFRWAALLEWQGGPDEHPFGMPRWTPSRGRTRRSWPPPTRASAARPWRTAR
jgi:hypothetical protein